MPVGVLLWNGPEPSLTVVTKMTLTFGPAGFAIAEEQASLRGPLASRFGCPLELDHPGDFAPRKASCDVLLTGNAHADAPSLVIGANVRIGSIRKRFYALASERAEAIPLSVAYLREGPSADSTEVTVGPMSPHHPAREAFAGVRIGTGSALRREVLSPDFDYGFFNSAPDDQRLTAIAPGMDVRLHGLAPGGAVIHGQLPTRWPRIHVPDERRGHGLREVGLVCDTLWIDTDRAVCELTFRGTLVLRQAGVLPARLIATLGEAFENVDLARIEARAAFALPVRATEPEDVEAPSARGQGAFSPATADTASEVLEELEPEPDADFGAAAEPERPPVQEPAPPPGPAPASPSTTAFDSLLAAGLPASSAAFFAGGGPTGKLDPRRKVAQTIVMPSGGDPERTMLHTGSPAPSRDPERTMLHTGSPAPSRDPERTLLHAPVPVSKADPERTMLHTGLPVRPQTLPFAGQSRPKTGPPRVAPPASGLPFLAPRGPRTLEVAAEANPLLAGGPRTLEVAAEANPLLAGGPRTLEVAAEANPLLAGGPRTLEVAAEANPLLAGGPRTLEVAAEANPLLAALPFGERSLRRIKTLDFAGGGELRAPLPFAGGAPPPPAQAKADVGSALPFAPPPAPPPAPPSATRAATPFAAPSGASPVFGWPPVAAPDRSGDDEPEPRTLVPPPPTGYAASASDSRSTGERAYPVADTPPPGPGAYSAGDSRSSGERAFSVGDTLPPGAGAESAEDTLPPGARGELDGDTLVPPARAGASDTLPPMAAMPSIPFAPPLPGGMGHVAPMGPATPPVGAGDPTVAPPWAAGLRPARGLADVGLAGARGRDDGKIGLFSLEKDAAIQLALWQSTAPLHETLAAHGTDELAWREHVRLRDAALRAEAEAGGDAKALAVHEAIERARQGPSGPFVPSLDLGAYAEVRLVLKDADDEGAALAARGIDVARWQQDHRHYRRRLRREPAFAEQLRAALEATTRAAGAAAGAAAEKDTAAPPRSPHDGRKSASHGAEKATMGKRTARVRKMAGKRTGDAAARGSEPRDGPPASPRPR